MSEHQITGAAATAMAALDMQREELDRLRAENATQRRLLDEAKQLVLDTQTHALNFINAEGENATLRELVREAHDDDLPGCHTHGPEWNERAEKATTPQT